MKLSFTIALRFLKSGGVQTLLILLGIAVGVSVQVFLGSLIGGLQLSLVKTTIGNSSQITVSSNQNNNKSISHWERTLYEIKNSSTSIKNISLAADSSAFVQNTDVSEPVLVRGFNYNEADKIYNINDRIYAGAMPQRRFEALMGKELAAKLNIHLNDYVYIVTPSGDSNQFLITGFYDLKTASINKSWIITDLATSQQMFGFDNQITSIEMQVDSVFQADSIANEIKRNITNKDLKIDNWKAQNQQLLSGLSGQSASSIMIQVFVMIAVLLGISSVLAISVVQKSKQIGILKAIGIRDVNASMIFVFQGLILGFFGAILGVAMGLGLTGLFSKFAVNADGTPIVAVYINIQFILLSGFAALATAVIAAIIPARLSSKLNPIEVIRNA